MGTVSWCVWFLLLLLHTGGVSPLTDGILMKPNSSHWRRHSLRDITSGRLGDAQGVMVWWESQRSEHRVDTFLADLDIPRLVLTSRDLNMANCELNISAFFVILEDTDEDDEVLTRFLAGVRRCWLRAHFVVVFPERRNPAARDHKYVQEVFQQFWLAEVADVVAILPYRDTVRVFTIFPYRESCHLPGLPVLVDQLPRVDGAFPSVGLFPDIKVTSLHGCSLRFTTIDLAPDVILNLSFSDKSERWTQQKEGAPIVKDSVDGIEVRLVNTLASTMNFSVIISLPHDGYYWGWVHYNGSVSGMIADISNNLSDVGFGHVTHSTQDIGFLEYSASLARDCYGWGVPLGAGQQPPSWVAFTTEFSLLTWGFIVAALLLAAVILWILPRVLPRWEPQEKELWGTPSSVMRYACGTLIMAPMWMKPSSQPVRIFAAFWLLYCIVVSVAYQAKMGSIVTVPWAPVNIRSLEELMESDLNLKAPWKLQKTLHKSDDDPVIRAIVARLQPVSTITELVDQLQSQKKQNFAYLMYRRSLMFYASQSGWKFHVMSEGCLMGHHTALVVRRGSLLIPRFNIIIQRLIDSGIVRKWARDFTPRRVRLESRSAGLTIQNMLGAFRVLILGHLLAVITLLVEFCHFKLTATPAGSHHLRLKQGDS